jgi:hypothetical protein
MFWNPQVDYRFLKNTFPISILSQINPVLILSCISVVLIITHPHLGLSSGVVPPVTFIRKKEKYQLKWGRNCGLVVKGSGR